MQCYSIAIIISHDLVCQSYHKGKILFYCNSYKNTITFNLELYILKTRIRSVILNNEPISAIDSINE